MKFNELALEPELLSAVAAQGFTACTSIQEKVLPLLLSGRDVAGQAQTGTGKTAAFLLASMQRMLDSPPRSKRHHGAPRTIVIAPTRELVIQIHNDAVKLSGDSGLKLELVFGGVDYDKQRRALQKPLDLLIGTPGRLIDYQRQGVLRLDAIETMVLDEADRMFDLGFIRDIRHLLRCMPPPSKRLNMLFSATLPWKVIELAHEHMVEPEVIKVEPKKIAVERIEQSLYHVSKDEKSSLLLGLLQKMDPMRSIIFVNTKAVAERLRRLLQHQGYNCSMLTGDIPQRKRMNLFTELTSGNVDMMVATDLAARGLHVPGVSHVFNYDLPGRAEDYVHRIGRTARAGASGDAISLACEQYVYSLGDIEKLLGNKIPTIAVTSELLIKYSKPPREPRKPHGRPHGGRPQQGHGKPYSGRPKSAKANYSRHTTQSR
ncbi:MAG: DEAD/DEAH box helicase [Candidatus Porifericomitaceae bacterium WSBS_2022_MAG_OTU9]